MSHFTLPVAGLPQEWTQLRPGGLYWLACELAADAEMLALQVLAAMPAEARASLVVCGRQPAELLDGLAADRGPGELWPYAFAEAGAAKALRRLGRELCRRHAPRGQLVLLLAPAACWDAFADAELEAWCGAQHAWLAQHGCSLLVLSHGGGAALDERLLGCNEPLAGLARLAHRHGALRYQLHFWRNALGVQAAAEFGLGRAASGFAVLDDATRCNASPAASDSQRCLARRTALEGAPPLSEHWQLFDDDTALLAAAGAATAACVIFTLGDNARVGELAEQLYRLRQRRGRALKLVVREMSPCMRYLDERLLLLCGASLIVPFGTGLSRFLSLLDSLHGQRWARSLPEDLPATLRRLRPPALRGLLPGREFVAVVRDLLAMERDAEVSHLLVRLRPVAGLSLSQVLGQCRLRRAGDLACAVGGDLWLFLFACRPNALEIALGHVFRLPWRELFASHRLFAAVEGLLR